MSNKITPDELMAVIKSIEYTRWKDSTMTICHMELQNGTIILGKSACIDPADFNERTGEDIAKKNAIDQLWNLEGYLKKQRLWEAAGKFPLDKPIPYSPEGRDDFRGVSAPMAGPANLPGVPIPESNGVKRTVPTVGRIVYYYPGCGEYFDGAEIGEPLAAIVCFVHDEFTINISVFSPNGKQCGLTNITLRHPEDEQPGNDYNEQDDVGGYAKWMPYQVAAAKKYPVAL